MRPDHARSEITITVTGAMGSVRHEVHDYAFAWASAPSP